MIQPTRQIGLSIVELMIALALSSVLILGATQIYIDNKRNYLFQQGQADNLESGRFALMVLERQLAKAGYRRRADDSLNFAFPAGTFSGCVFTQGQTIARVDDTTLCLRYQPRDNVERDCAGNAPSLSTPTILDKPYTAYAPSQGDAFVERISLINGQLTCNDAVLASGIAGIRFGFGIGPPGEREVSSYSSSPGNNHIRNLRYSLLLVSDRGRRQGMTSQAYCSWHGQASCTPPDDRLYHLASSSMTLRNLMP